MQASRCIRSVDQRHVVHADWFNYSVLESRAFDWRLSVSYQAPLQHVTAGTRAPGCLVRLHGAGLACTGPVPALVPVPAHSLCGQGQHGRGCPSCPNSGNALFTAPKMPLFCPHSALLLHLKWPCNADILHMECPFTASATPMSCRFAAPAMPLSCPFTAP